jgi:uncharacterized OB-fold protein
MSAPAQKPLPAPVRTTTRVLLSALTASRASRKGIITSKAIAFIRSGLLSVISETDGRGLSISTNDMGPNGTLTSMDKELAPRVPVREGLFEEGDPPHLIGSFCASCGSYDFPAHDACSICTSGDVERTLLSPQGRLWAWTAVTAAPPGYKGSVPYGFGVVELPEALRIVTRLTEPDPTSLRAGQSMALRIVPLHSDEQGREVLTYAFAPDPAA